MSAAINLAVSEAKIAVHCAIAGISISAIETLPAGGCRLVCLRIDGAEQIRLHFQDHVIEGPVQRFSPFRSPWR